MDYTSSIMGAPPKATRYFFDLTLDGTAQDEVHTATSNGLGGLTFNKYYYSAGGAPVRHLDMRLDPSSAAHSIRQG